MTPYITTGKEEAPSYIQDGVHLYMRKEGFKKAAGTAAKCVLTAALVFNTAVPAYAFDVFVEKMQTEGTNSINAHEGDYIELNCSDSSIAECILKTNITTWSNRRRKN